MFGLDPSLAVPDQARRLLGEAGCPDRFGLTIHGPNDRLVNDAQIVEAVGQMLSRIGIAAKVETLPMAAYAGRGAKGEDSRGLIGFGSQTGESRSILRAIIACADSKSGGGLYNWSYYCNAEVDAALAQAFTTVDNAAREALLRRAAGLASASRRHPAAAFPPGPPAPASPSRPGPTRAVSRRPSIPHRDPRRSAIPRAFTRGPKGGLRQVGNCIFRGRDSFIFTLYFMI